MANIFLACVASTKNHPFARRDFERMLKFAALDEVKRHVLVNYPGDADLVVFMESCQPNFSDIFSSMLYRENKEKAVLFYSGDKLIPLLPGVYASLEDRWYLRHRKGALSGFYLRTTENETMDIHEDIQAAKFLFSFVGNAENHPVRKLVCGLSHGRAFVRDSSADARKPPDEGQNQNRARELHYRTVMAQSKFILCPAGQGASSWRLFETMRAGRVPVIISDHWIPPEGPRWDSFAIIVPEHQVQGIPRLLEKREIDVVRFASIARAEWMRCYSEKVVFSTAIDLLLQAHAGAQVEGLFSKMATYFQYFEPFYFRHWVISSIKGALLRRMTPCQ